MRARTITALFILSLLNATAASAEVPKSTEVLIIGAGLSGMAAAHELKKAGIPYHVVELTPRVGGRVRTVTYDLPGEKPLSADSGMEEYWESNPAVPLLRELKLKVRSDFAASSLRLQGRLETLAPDDDGPSFLKRIFSKEEGLQLEAFKQRAGALLSRLHEARSGGTGFSAFPEDLRSMVGVSFKDWVKGGAGAKLRVSDRVAEWIRISVECEAGTHWDRFSALDGLAEFHIFLGEGEKSYRVVAGNEAFAAALADSIGRRNITLNRMVKKIDTSRVDSGGPIRVSWLDTATNRSGVVEARHVISTIPLFRLFEVQFVPALSQAKRDGIASQTWGSYFKVHVFVKPSGRRFWEKGGHSILPILSDSPLGVIYDGAPDYEGATRLVSLLVTGDDAEGFNFAPLDAVRSRLEAEFEKLWPGFAKEITGMEFYRYHPRAVAGWPVGRSRFDAQSEEIRTPERGVILAGDFTEGTHSSGAFESARRAVLQVKDARARAVQVKTPAMSPAKASAGGRLWKWK